MWSFSCIRHGYFTDSVASNSLVNCKSNLAVESLPMNLVFSLTYEDITLPTALFSSTQPPQPSLPPAIMDFERIMACIWKVWGVNLEYLGYDIWLTNLEARGLEVYLGKRMLMELETRLNYVNVCVRQEWFLQTPNSSTTWLTNISRQGGIREAWQITLLWIMGWNTMYWVQRMWDKYYINGSGHFCKEGKGV